jgi:hypothetical protein
MALSEDQRALLRLLLDGEDYDAIGSLLGEGPDAVRERAHEALAAAGESDPPLADAVRERLLRLDGAEPTDAAEAPSRVNSPSRRLALWLPLTVGAVALAVIVLVASGAFDGDSPPEPSSAPGPDREDVVVIALKPVGGASAKGSARLIRIDDLPTLDIDVTGLEPSGPEETYIVWLYNSPGEAFPVSFQSVAPNGRLEGRISIPAAAGALLASFDGLDVSLAGKREAAAAVDEAAQGGGIPRHVGRSVVRGKFPRGG